MWPKCLDAWSASLEFQRLEPDSGRSRLLFSEVTPGHEAFVDFMVAKQSKEISGSLCVVSPTLFFFIFLVEPLIQPKTFPMSNRQTQEATGCPRQRMWSSSQAFVCALEATQWCLPWLKRLK